MKRLFPYLFCLAVCGCVSVKKQTLWDEPAQKPEPPKIGNFYGLSVLQEGLSSEVWFTQNEKCLKVENSENVVFAGSKAVHLKWDKQAGGCPWLGMGIGWDGWTGKDLSRILDKAAIQFRAYDKERTIKSLPLAAALEDYGGKQAWLGFAGNVITHPKNSEWALITLPLADFSWGEFGADASNIKQLIIQFEAAGDIYIDEVKLVKFKGNSKKRYSSLFIESPEIEIDGMPTETAWKGVKTLDVDRVCKVKVLASNDALYLSGYVYDPSFMENSKTDADIWNGDAIEFAISTNSESNKRRKTYRYSDYQIGAKMTDNPLVWDWTRKKRVKNATVVVQMVESGYSFELRIPNSHFELDKWQANTIYGFEFALDLGTRNGREKQIRWNSGGIKGFNKNPSLWGEIEFKLPDS